MECERCLCKRLFWKKIINFKSNNLHLVGYSTPINQIISKEKFIDHLHSLPDQPNAIPC